MVPTLALALNRPMVILAVPRTWPQTCHVHRIRPSEDDSRCAHPATGRVKGHLAHAEGVMNHHNPRPAALTLGHRQIGRQLAPISGNRHIGHQATQA
jgi:hypothetical protein